MDSLLASYCSSDEEEEESLNSKSTSKRGGILNSMPPPKSSLFNSLPPPKTEASPSPNSQAKFEQLRQEQSLENSIPEPKPSFSSLLASIPRPKSLSSSLPSVYPSPNLSASSNSKKVVRVVQLKPPTVRKPISGDDESKEDDEGEKERQRKRSKESVFGSSGNSLLPGILPPPKNSTSLGTLGTGRKSMFETVAPVSTGGTAGAVESDAVAQSNSSVGYTADQSQGKGYDVGEDSNISVSGVQSDEMNYNYTTSDGYSAGDGANVDYSYGDVNNLQNISADGSCVDYGNNALYENNWGNETVLSDVSKVISELRVPGKRGRKDALPEIVEVKQDELMKNRPREDQAKSTGIAFGPAYQPAASSKGKPTKLHKRKHQIGALYFDMRQKESELAERRSQGFQTKAQTQRKYGWS